MGTPSNDLAYEIISAMSSLNMEAELIVPAPVRDPDSIPLFLSQTDAWAKHSMEHLRQAMKLIHERQPDSLVQALTVSFPSMSEDAKHLISSMAHKHFIQGV